MANLNSIIIGSAASVVRISELGKITHPEYIVPRQPVKAGPERQKADI